jgi:hypothetical protein
MFNINDETNFEVFLKQLYDNFGESHWKYNKDNQYIYTELLPFLRIFKRDPYVQLVCVEQYTGNSYAINIHNLNFPELGEKFKRLFHKVVDRPTYNNFMKMVCKEMKNCDFYKKNN